MKIKSLIAMVAVGLGLVSVSHADAYWRWTSNATAPEPIWNEVGDETLSVPAFEGATAADNVLEILDDCAVTSALTFSKNCTIRTRPGLDVKTVTFAKGMTDAQDTDIHKVYCDANATIVTSNVTFQGNIEWGDASQIQVLTPAAAHSTKGYANLAWRVNTGKSLTLGSGTTVRNFLTSEGHSVANFIGGAVVVYNNATLNVEDGAKITDCRGQVPPIMIMNACVGAVVNMKGGEITRCYAGGGRGGAAIGGLQGTINLTGGWIHGNLSYQSGSGGVYIYWNGGNTAPRINISGKPVIEDNYLGLNASSKLNNLTAADNDFIHLAGDLEEGANVGCSYDNIDGHNFGTADNAFTGARYIHADDGSGLVGVVKDVDGTLRLQWSSQVDPEPNRWTTAPAVEPNEWVSGAAPGTITEPVAVFGNATKVATISKDGGDPITWDEIIPEEPGAYTITWTIEGTSDYAELEGSVEFTVLAETRKYWRWTSNAQDATPTWTKSEDTVLFVPAFTGATAADNVLELLGDCAITNKLTFSKNCTIRTQPGLDIKTVTFAKGMTAAQDEDIHKAYCVADATIVTSNITFQGNIEWTDERLWMVSPALHQGTSGYANGAWSINRWKTLTLGPGTTVRNFLTDGAWGGANGIGGVIALTLDATLNVEDGAKITECRGLTPPIMICYACTTAVVNMKGGEITRCYANGGRGGGAIGGLQGTINLTGGWIHGNIGQLGSGGVYILWNGGGTAPKINLSGKPVIEDNYLRQNNVNTLCNLKADSNDRIHLAGDLEEGAYVGCSQNLGEGNQFGTANGKYKGAELIHADDGSKLVGLVRQGKLIWGVPGGFLLLVR